MQFVTKEARQFIYDILENQSKGLWGRVWERGLFLLIFLNVFFATLETVNDFSIYHPFFWWFEVISVTVFTIEYGLRIWVATEKKKYTGKWGRLKYMLTPLMLFDLLVLLPFYFLLLAPGLIDTRTLRILRLVRIVRILRVSRYTFALERVLKVLHREKEELAAIFSLMMVLLLISSTLMFLAESRVPDSPFTSIPATFWWGIATLTTIGYGDLVPITNLGRLLGSITAIFGVGIFALPTGLLGASFYKEVNDQREKRLRKISAEIDLIKTFNEERGDKLDAYTRRQMNKIKALEDKIDDMEEYAEKKGVDFEKMKKKKPKEKN